MYLFNGQRAQLAYNHFDCNLNESFYHIQLCLIIFSSLAVEAELKPANAPDYGAIGN